MHACMRVCECVHARVWVRVCADLVVWKWRLCSLVLGSQCSCCHIRGFLQNQDMPSQHKQWRRWLNANKVKNQSNIAPTSTITTKTTTAPSTATSGWRSISITAIWETATTIGKSTATTWGLLTITITPIRESSTASSTIREATVALTPIRKPSTTIASLWKSAAASTIRRSPTTSTVWKPSTLSSTVWETSTTITKPTASLWHGIVTRTCWVVIVLLEVAPGSSTAAKLGPCRAVTIVWWRTSSSSSTGEATASTFPSWGSLRTQTAGFCYISGAVAQLTMAISAGWMPEASATECCKLWRCTSGLYSKQSMRRKKDNNDYLKYWQY